MGAPSSHGQRNKPHKGQGNKGPSARQRHKAGREGGGDGHRVSAKAGGNAQARGKQERQLAAKQLRDAKRQELLDRKRRQGGSPLVVAILPLSKEVDVPLLWSNLLEACDMPAPGSQAGGGAKSRRPSTSEAAAAHQDTMMGLDGTPALNGSGKAGSEVLQQLRACTVGVMGRPKLRLTLLPPPADRSDPLAVVELGKAAEVLLLAVPGREGATAVDPDGHMALAVLRTLGLPEVAVAVQCPGQHPKNGSAAAVPDDDMGMAVDDEDQGGNHTTEAGRSKPAAPSMKERSAAKKRAEKAVGAVLAGGVAEGRHIYHTDTPTDCAQLVRHLAERPTPEVPVWRRQRPSLMVEHAEWNPLPADQQQGGPRGPVGSQQAGQEGQQQQGQDPVGVLEIRGCVRCAGLSANQLVHIPGAGDFQIECILAAEDQVQQQRQQHQRQRQGGRGGGGAQGMDQDPPAQAPVLAQADPESQEPLVRVNVPTGSEAGEDGEQTWPTEAELEDVQKLIQQQQRKKKFPKGTSEYQAAWIIDEGEDDEENDEEEEDGMSDDAPDAAPMADDGEEEARGDIIDEDETGTVADMGVDEDEEEAEAAEPENKWARMQAELRARREAEGEDAEHPDEFDVPPGVEARVRLQKYRGLKSFRSSPWDPKEWLPAEYGRVFAFENFKRAHKRAKEAVARATRGADPCAVEPGSYVTLRVTGVPASLGEAVVARASAAWGLTPQGSSMTAPPSQPPLVVFGLMAHEAKLSVVHFSVKKASGYSDPIPNKEQLLFVTGLRTFSAQPIFSSDTAGDKQKMERWLKAGEQAVASVYAPICYAPLPLLAFKLDPMGEGHPRLAAIGALRGCDPDRIVLKKIVLTGFPVRVHKRRCTVRYMFHNPDDIRWFRPVELYTRSGRRGRITEPLGTHGAMKTLFDGPVQQREVVCMSLYKRVFPKWPGDLVFAGRG